MAKRSLSGHLRDPEKYIPLIERRVEYTSKLQQLGSLLVNQYIVKKLNNGETQFLDQLHITSGARSGLLKGIFRTAMLLFTDDNRAPHPNAPASAPELRALHTNYARGSINWKNWRILEKLWKIAPLQWRQLSEIRCNLDWNRASETRSSSNSPVAGWSSAGTKSQRCFARSLFETTPEHPRNFDDFVQDQAHFVQP